MVQPFLSLPWYGQCQYRDVKHNQYLHTSLVLVTLPCLASLRTGCVSILIPVLASRCPCPAPCPAEQHLSLCQQHRAASAEPRRVPGGRGRRVFKSWEGRGTLSPTLCCRASQGHSSWLETDGSGKGQRHDLLNNLQLFWVSAVAPSLVPVLQTTAVLSRHTT